MFKFFNCNCYREIYYHPYRRENRYISNALALNEGEETRMGRWEFISDALDLISNSIIEVMY
jgi:hypothetical protein